MKYRLKTKELLSDLYTPVGSYLKLRQEYHQILLLESSDYSSKENSRSFLCFNALEGICLSDNSDKKTTKPAISQIKEFLSKIEIEDSNINHGVFGYSCYESVEFFETIKFDNTKKRQEVPTMRYDFYKYTIVFDHFHNKLEIREYLKANEESQIDKIIQLLNHQDIQTFDFGLNGKETCNISESKYIDNIIKAKEHLQRGDIFQVVLSRGFQQAYTGDVINVYRQLRSINPSPYLYFFDYGNYRIFGSSPEAQIVVKNQKAEIHPIAGTFRRSGQFDKDLLRAEALKNDPKENAEHVMLVDLARNDLSKHAHNVHVKKYKEVQFFSHVIHLTSIVEGTLDNNTDGITIYGDTFPAGTLSGAPKYKAMQIIDKLETTQRGIYGGAIGMIGLNGDINHAILIRSFLAMNNKLSYQAGAGIVMDSDPKSELQEVNNKLEALKKAIQSAEKI